MTLYKTVTMNLLTGETEYKDPVEVTEEQYEEMLQPLAEILFNGRS